MAIRANKNVAIDLYRSARFIEAARELGCDEFPDAFEAAAKKVARHEEVEERFIVSNTSPSTNEVNMLNKLIGTVSSSLIINLINNR